MSRNDLAVVSAKTLASWFGCDARSVGNYVKEGMPKDERGKFDPARAIPWFLQRERERARSSKGLNDLDLARQRKTIAEAELAEMELAKARDELIPLALHEQRLRERLETVAGSVKAIHRYQPEVKAAVTDVAADALLDKMSDEMLAELHGLTDEIAA